MGASGGRNEFPVSEDVSFEPKRDALCGSSVDGISHGDRESPQIGIGHFRSVGHVPSAREFIIVG